MAGSEPAGTRVEPRRRTTRAAQTGSAIEGARAAAVAEPGPETGDGARASKAPSPRKTIGRAGEEVLALAFGGGAFDTAMQLGVVHALVVSESRPPDAVAGISAGAIHAVALADVLQAGADAEEREKKSGRSTLSPSLARRQAQLKRLGELVEEFELCRDTLLRATLPDAYETRAVRALEPLQSPIQFDKERAHRREEAEARAGLTRLMNHLLDVRVRISTLTVAVRYILGIRAAVEEPNPVLRVLHILYRWAWLYLLAWINVFHLAPIVGRLTWAASVGEPPRRRGTTTGKIVQWSWVRAVWRVLVYLFWLMPTAILLVLALLGIPSLAFFRWARGRYLAKRRRERRRPWRWLTEPVLRRYGIWESLGRAHVLRTTFVRLFDPGFYGRVGIEEAVERALLRDGEGDPERGSQPRPLARFREHPTAPVYVAPVAADLTTGALVEVAQDTPVVTALMAAVAKVPLMPSVELPSAEEGSRQRVHLVDGTNVANEPTSALLDILRHRVDPDARTLRVFPVSALPVSKGVLPGIARKEYLSTVEVTRRVLHLGWMRDADLERRLTELYTRLLPEGKVRVPVAQSPGHPFLRAEIHPIEPDAPLHLNYRLIVAEGEDEARRAIREAVADGCRSTLETILAPDIRGLADGEAPPERVPCGRVVALRRRDPDPVPAEERPGLRQVCDVCALRGATVGTVTDQGSSPERRARVLRVLGQNGAEGWRWPKWGSSEGAPPASPKGKGGREEPVRKDSSGDPVVSLLFSGGVFRGVFQVGVLNGLDQAGVKPRLVAGASVGSIVGGMGASLFAESDRSLRQRKMALLAGTFLGLDRLILTDRFADAVRHLTLRAAASRFSPRDLDRVFRRYDADDADTSSWRLRRVLAGLERLLYVSPFEVTNWVRAARDRNHAALWKLFQEDLQEFFERQGLGTEILGAEPLKFLIDEQVLSAGADEADGAERGNGADESFTRFRDKAGDGDPGIDLLAVTTNLTEGRLEILPPPSEAADRWVLREGLLASSAFPSIFRPRHAWEISSDRSGPEQYVDGGVVDNLPLDAVVKFLDKASLTRAVSRRPRAPHLLLAASLEPHLERLDPEEARKISGNWIDVLGRTRKLAYNRKIESYAKAQRHFRKIFESPLANRPEFEPLDIEVVAIKPRWLCGTFAFHPMLGFRRKRQAESIAHGCATTLATLWLLGRHAPTDKWTRAWGFGVSDFDPSTVDVPDGEFDPSGSPPVLRPDRRSSRAPGGCWFREGAMCPFSEVELARVGSGQDRLSPPLRRELTAIHVACGKWVTHSARR